jgi:Putative cell-wall binding lipoprotein
VKGISRIILTVISVFIFVFMTSGCGREQSTADKLYKALENVAAAEKQFEDQQEPLKILESQEREIYKKIMKLGMKQHDEIVKLADEALVMVEKREAHIKKETDSIKQSEEEFKKVGVIKERLVDTEQKKKADELNEIMLKRYQAHEQLTNLYSDALVKDKELYKMLKDKNISFEELEKQVITLNETYQKVLNLNEEFNTLTVQYNAKKLEFYQSAGLQIAEE